MQDDSIIPVGLCQCGCGQKTNTKTSGGSKKWVGPHYRYCYQHQSRKSPLEYIVDPSTGCWNWQRGKDSSGYGVCTFNGKETRSHRMFYERFKGPIPEGHQIDHLCRNHACCNPAHLEAVSKAVNVRRGAAAKLSPDAVERIRALAGTMPQTKIAKIFGVHSSVVCRVVNRKTWR